METKTFKKATRSWKSASLLGVTNKDSNFVYRWITSENVERRQTEGWEIVRSSSESKEKGPAITLSDGSKIDGVIKKRNLILARMPVELAESRRDYFRQLSKGAMKNQEQEFKDGAQGSSYGSIKIER